MHLLPIQVGPATDYAISRKRHFLGLVVLQLLMAIIALTDFGDIVSAIMVAVASCFGYAAAHHSMNITYLTVWGLLCLAHSIVDTIMSVFSVLGAVITLRISEVFVRCLIVLSSLAGVIMWWWLYSDYENERIANGEAPEDILGKILSTCGLLRRDEEAALRPSRKKQQQMQPHMQMNANDPDYGTRIVDAKTDSEPGMYGFGQSLGEQWNAQQWSGPFSGLMASSPQPDPRVMNDGRVHLGNDPFFLQNAP